MLQRLFDRQDFRENPVLAITKRFYWRIRWLLTQKPFPATLPNGLQVVLPHTGGGALIYYMGWSEPDTASFLNSFLKPGMTVADVGAHIGEFSYLASKKVGDEGSVHCFEPNQDLFNIIKQNIESNRLSNISPNCAIVSNDAGIKKFWIHKEASMSSMMKSQDDQDSYVQEIDANSIRLDDYFCKLPTVDLIKVDVEGAELLVFQGADELLSRENAPVLLFEYCPEHYTAYGYVAQDILCFLKEKGYHYFTNTAGKPIDLENPDILFENVVASRHTI